MEKNDLYEAIQAALAMLDADEAPECRAYLENIISDDDRPDITEEDAFTIANELLKLDKPAPLAKVLRDLVEELFEAAFESGNADAMNDLGALYYDGDRGFDQDFAKAVEYYKLAAQKGSRQAQENLGYCYYYGRNMPVDYEKAFHCFALGAFDGHLISLYKIGDMYRSGYYV